MANNIKEVLEDTTWSGVAYGIDTHQIDEALAEIKRIIEEAKPKNAIIKTGGDYEQIQSEITGYNNGTEDYHKNLLKALGE